jgi:hypothetical protein
MATTTPNFGWPVPTSTDLVKNGATAIEALGDAIDASLVDLEGGTTGQVLAKASNADMDFAWVAQDDSNAIQNSIVDAKGDLISATANDTPARLAVGSNGETLVADSSTSTGLRYQVPVNVNPVLNSAFQIWQRGTSFAVAAGSAFTADRFNYYSAVSGRTISRQSTNDTTNLPFIQYCARIQRDSGNTNTSQINLGQSFETINSIPYAGKTITFSFYARAGANYSAASNGLLVVLSSGTGTDQNIVSAGYTGSTNVVVQTATLTTTWQRFTYTGSVASTATELGFYFGFTPSGTAGANDYFETTGLQIEIASVATPFKTYAGTIQGELAACQRYYFRYKETSGSGRVATGFGISTTTGEFVLPFPTTMRVQPSALEYGGTLVWYDGLTGASVGTIVFAAPTTDATGLQFSGSSGLSAYRPIGLTFNASNSYIGLTAEL